MNYKDICKKLIDNGVNIIDINTTYIDESVVIEEGTIIYPNTSIRGETVIGKDNIIDMNSIIIDSNIGNNNHLKSSYIENSNIGSSNEIGPFAHIKNQTIITDKTVIGNFVEIKKSIIGEGSKVKHLSYLGDVTLGRNVNIGAGSIFANYNSITKEKNKTLVEDNVSIGANSVLISPVTLKRNSFIAAGSIITYDVEEYCLAIARSRQINKINYIKKEGNV